MKASHLRPTAVVTLVAFLASMGLGCGGSPDTSEDGAEALTVQQTVPPDARALITDAYPTRESVTGAHRWHLYSLDAADIGNSAHSAFNGLIAYGTDRNGQVVWIIVIDNAHPEKKGVQRVDPEGHTIATTITTALATAFDAELTNLRDLVAKAQSPFDRAKPPPAAAVIDATGITVGVLGYIALSAPAIAIGAAVAISVMLLIVVVYAATVSVRSRP